jgi:hypothetical protein
MGVRGIRQLSRVAPVSRDNPGVRDILKHFPVEDGERWVFGVELFGREMERAVIFRAWPQKRKRTPRPKLEHATAGTVRRRA